MIKREMAAKARELWSKYPVLTLTRRWTSSKFASGMVVSMSGFFLVF